MFIGVVYGRGSSVPFWSHFSLCITILALLEFTWLKHNLSALGFWQPLCPSSRYQYCGANTQWILSTLLVSRSWTSWILTCLVTAAQVPVMWPSSGSLFFILFPLSGTHGITQQCRLTDCFELHKKLMNVSCQYWNIRMPQKCARMWCKSHYSQVPRNNCHHW